MPESDGLAKKGAVKLADHGIFGWVEDKGTKTIDKVIGRASPFLAAAALSFKAWLAQNWVGAIQIAVPVAVATYLVFNLLRAGMGAWRTNREVLLAVANLPNGANAGLVGEVAELTKQVAALAAAQKSASPGNVSGIASFSSAHAPVTSIETPWGNRQVAAIGIPRSISIQHLQFASHHKFRCECQVDFVGWSSGDASPTELLLTTHNGLHMLTRLRVPNGQPLRLPATLTYKGDGAWQDLMAAVAETMADPKPGEVAPWYEFPPRSAIYCDVELRLPDGELAANHARAKAKLLFELTGQIYQSVRLLIEPWESAEGTVSVTQLLQ